MIFGQYATGYSEDGSKGFVTLSDGSVLSADVVVAADGVGSKSHALLSNDLQSPISSGYAIFRASYPLEDAMADPCVKAHWGDKEEHLSIILGPDVHLLIGKNDARNTMCWMLTHKDVEGTSQESWKETTEASAALKFVPDESG
jgi:2-polyprenyl-6-methoxyphenol hydroxylase-like FAD-dependent oxidoreductase